jgi:RNA:NAD 2'-phosphotransferase (TPT1/KptA family)
MPLYHATHIRNLDSIQREGILTKYATGRSPTVWLHASSMWSYALHHVAERHGWEVGDVVLIEVFNRRIPTRATRWHGIYNTAEDIPPEDLGKVFQLTRFEIREQAPANPHTPAA